MKKALLFALILMVLVVFFVACDSNITPPADTDPPVTDSAEHVHTWSDWIVLTKPTCELGGQEQRYCSVCYELQNKPLEATGHTEVIDQAVPPTCTGTGLTEGKHCSVCRTVLVEQNTVDAAGHIPSAEATCTMAQLCLACNVELAAALGHTESEWILDKASTCTERGSRHKECTVCKDTVKTETLYLLDHVDSDWIVDRPSTCTEGGYRHKECTSCGTTTHTGTLLALGHNYVASVTPPTLMDDGYTDYVCEFCSDSYTERIVPTSLSINSSNRDWIGYTGATNEELVIPAIIQHDEIWYRVTGIADLAFSFCEELTVVNLPASVTNVGGYAFQGCKGLTSISIPDSVTSISKFAFSGCSGLISIDIPSSVISIGASAFANCSGLTSIIIPDSVRSIGVSAFFGCSNMTDIILPVGLTAISNEMFASCRSLTNIILPDSVRSIGASAFYNCTNLTKITLPERVRDIGISAFAGCSQLVSIIIPSRVETIGNTAFIRCTKLTTITFNDTSDWFCTTSYVNAGGTNVDVTNNTANVTYFISKYKDYNWYKV